ncbi:uncharacterized protein LOC132259188 [Phlebotomus argentipes]|uniref:uncharacterized protein LOC132259188 n=1 Tax=Phlebotomus argentipes TaxID=94469 RepID=UPI002893284D|nr:uncharacterized protein LOC132259188 [Phlebotomus argentipes]
MCNKKPEASQNTNQYVHMMYAYLKQTPLRLHGVSLTGRDGPRRICSGVAIPFSLITNFFRARNVLSVVYYSCQNDGYIAVKTFNEANYASVIVSKDPKNNPSVLFSRKNGIVVDLSCGFVPNLLTTASENYLFREIISWIFIKTEENENMQFLLQTYIPMSSEVALFSHSNGSWNIFDLYSVSKEFDLIITPIQANVINRRKKSLNGIKIKATIAFHHPERLTRVDDIRMRHLDTIPKIIYQILMNLALDLNITYNLRQTDSYGYFKNGSWTGVMGHFEKKQIEVGMMSAFLREDRMKLVEYITESYILRSPLMFRQPSLASVSNIFTLPFGLDVWWSFIVLIIVLILLQVLIITTPMMRNEYSLLDSISFVLGAICQQGFDRNSFLLSWRIFHFVSFLSSLFLFSSYSANIVALLQSPSNALQSVSDVTHSNLKVLVQENEYNPILYGETTNPEVIELYKKKIKPFGDKAYEVAEVGVIKIRTGKFAYQVETHTAYKIISDIYTESEKCGLKEIESISIPRHSLPIVKNSSYRGIFRERLTWQREVGLYDATLQRWVVQRFKKCEGNVGEFASVGILECRHAFMIAILGCLVSLIIFIIEDGRAIRGGFLSGAPQKAIHSRNDVVGTIRTIVLSVSIWVKCGNATVFPGGLFPPAHTRRSVPLVWKSFWGACAHFHWKVMLLTAGDAEDHPALVPSVGVLLWQRSVPPFVSVSVARGVQTQRMRKYFAKCKLTELSRAQQAKEKPLSHLLGASVELPEGG